MTSAKRAGRVSQIAPATGTGFFSEKLFNCSDARFEFPVEFHWPFRKER
ncbi:hypothetical protein OHAE_2697 [Ochrobactrum soli]|uniref:Uncharacterized protein n=1 Tax=Ochrobactrum soli TaxID=2448455 RepID=A0A2P9HF97_9HYPH|nr:hypothetical protein OHAE_2697 [[Ochrobactrum] soli]